MVVFLHRMMHHWHLMRYSTRWLVVMLLLTLVTFSLQNLREQSAKQTIHVGAKGLEELHPFQHVVAQDTVYWKEWNPSTSTLPLLVFVAGVEGSGHHNFGLTLERCFDHAFSFVPDIWIAQYYSWVPYTWANASDLYDRFTSNGYGVSVIGKRAILDYQHSFPFGWFRSTLFHPDLRTLIDMDGVYFDLRIIFLHRDPTETVVSAFKRGFVSDPFLQARVVESALMYMDRVIELMPPEKVAVINYNRYRQSPGSYIDTLLGISGYCDAEMLMAWMHQADQRFEHFRARLEEKGQVGLCPREYRRIPLECDDFTGKLKRWFDVRRKYWPRMEIERLPKRAPTH